MRSPVTSLTGTLRAGDADGNPAAPRHGVLTAGIHVRSAERLPDDHRHLTPVRGQRDRRRRRDIRTRAAWPADPDHPVRGHVHDRPRLLGHHRRAAGDRPRPRLRLRGRSAVGGHRLSASHRRTAAALRPAWRPGRPAQALRPGRRPVHRALAAGRRGDRSGAADRRTGRTGDRRRDDRADRARPDDRLVPRRTPAHQGAGDQRRAALARFRDRYHRRRAHHQRAQLALDDAVAGADRFGRPRRRAHRASRLGRRPPRGPSRRAGRPAVRCRAVRPGVRDLHRGRRRLGE